MELSEKTFIPLKSLRDLFVAVDVTYLYRVMIGCQQISAADWT